MKHESIGKATYAESQNVRSSLSWNWVEYLKNYCEQVVWNDSHFAC